MKHTGMPAFRPTANSIWNSFRSSGKRHLILTGPSGGGTSAQMSELFSVSPKDNQVDSGSEWICIDETEFPENNCENYKNIIHSLSECRHVAAVVCKENLTLLAELRSRQDVFLVDLDRPFGNTGCVIMASGLGKRFGENKLMADFRGSPMLTRILDATEGLFADRVVVTRHRSVEEMCRERKISVVFHDLPHRSDTVRLGLEAMTGVEHCVFCPADQPLLRKETIESLLLCTQNKKHSIWRTCCHGVPGSPVVFPRWTFPELLSLPEGKGGSYVVKKYPEQTDMLHIADPMELVDVDVRETLELLNKQC